MEQKILYHTRFARSFKKRVSPNRQLVEEFREVLVLFIQDPSSPILNDHPLTEVKAEERAFWVTDDVRVVYKRVKEGILLCDIGSHPEVYSG